MRETKPQKNKNKGCDLPQRPRAKKGKYHEYYFAYKQTQRICDRSEYVQAWFEYWDDIESGLNCYDAIANMMTDHGGVARKQPIPAVNGIYNAKIEYMLSLIQQSIESDYAG